MATYEQLDADISDLHTRINTLKAHRANLSSVLLSQPHLAARLQTQPSPSTSNPDPPEVTQKVITQQSRRNLENIHRACVGVTAYKVSDPDPHAQDHGNILGVRIDVALGGKFVETYHVLLNYIQNSSEGEEKKKSLRIHKHTIPACIPLQHLVNRWLQAGGKDGEMQVHQNLIRFGRSLRKELVSYHLRQQTLHHLRTEAGLEHRNPNNDDVGIAATGRVLNAFVSDDGHSSDTEEAEDEDEASNPARILDIEADTAVRQVTVTWSSRTTAVVCISKDGRVEKAVCRTKNGSRDEALSRKAIGPLRGLVRRLVA
ncbi:hypothetical protein EJ02DRAFT_449824 [Clathrospora elynae]|uniref:Cenp-O kinetochore centromere component n=1 Tax=Clathrospora elynae TaxID=706981 RepID=A0A6A5T577_9PLEO|nr:hypothetical protein EJ02DRAFT_449824 [Clathrospora elynae]